MLSQRVCKILLCTILIAGGQVSAACADVSYQPYYYNRDAVMFARPYATPAQDPSAAVVVRPSQSDSPAFSSISIRTQQPTSINSSASAEPVNTRPQYYAPAGHPQPVQNTNHKPPEAQMDEDTIDLGSGFGW